MPNTPLHTNGHIHGGNGNYTAFATPGFASPPHGHVRHVSISTPLQAPPPTFTSPSSSASIHQYAHGHGHASPVAHHMVAAAPSPAAPAAPTPTPGTRGSCPCENAESGCLITSWMDPHHQFMYTHPKRLGILCARLLVPW